MSEWICTKCNWTGNYSQTLPVMYHGIDWQNCPSCNSVAIPNLLHYINSTSDSADKCEHDWVVVPCKPSAHYKCQNCSAVRRS